MRKVDTVVVGGRVAGASLGARLAQAGQRVVVLESDELGTDQVFSTHAIQSPAVDQLRELGVLQEVLEHTPWVKATRMQLDDVAIEPPLAEGQWMLAPRRHVLDAALQRAAQRSGADLRGSCKVSEVMLREGRAVGVRYRTPAGALDTVEADVVVGADGRRSLVADQVRASTYRETTSKRTGHWAYFNLPDAMRSGAFRVGFHIAFHGDTVAFMFHTGHDEVLMGVQINPGAAEETLEPQAALESAFRKHPNSAVLLEGAKAHSKSRRLLTLDFFFRQAAGPGWALVGDAGLHKDPTPGFGMTDALRDSKALSAALVKGGDDALHAYWIERDRASLPLYALAEDMGAPEYANEFNRMMFRRVNADPALAARLVDVFARKRLPSELLSPSETLRYCLAETLRGRLGVWPGLLRGVKAGISVQRDLDTLEDRLAAMRDVKALG